MKTGLTGIGRNVYAFSGKKEIGFGKTKPNSEKTVVERNDKKQEDKAIDKKTLITGTIAAIAIPTTIAALAIYGKKIKKTNPKTNTNAIQKVAPKIEKEITKSDLMKNSQEIVKMLSVLKTTSTQKYSVRNLNNTEMYLSRYISTLEKVFGENLVKSKFANLQNLSSALNTLCNNEHRNFDSDKKEVSLEKSFIKYIEQSIKDITCFILTLQRFDSISDLKTKMQENLQKNNNKIQNWRRTSITNLMEEYNIEKKVIDASTLPISDYDFSGKTINSARVVTAITADGTKEHYLAIDSESDIIPEETKKKASGFTIKGSQGKRFFAIALTDVTGINILNMAKNAKFLQSLLYNSQCPPAALELIKGKLKDIKPETMLQALKDDKTKFMASSTAIQSYIIEKTVPFMLTDDEDRQPVINDVDIQRLAYGHDINVDNTEQENTTTLMSLLLLLNYEATGKQALSLIINKIGDDMSLYASYFKAAMQKTGFSKDYQNEMKQLHNIAIMAKMNTLNANTMEAYKEFYEANKDNINNLQDNEALYVDNYGKTHKNETSDTFDYKFSITKQNKQVTIQNLNDLEIGCVLSVQPKTETETKIDTEFNFTFSLSNITNQIQDIFSRQDIFDINMVKPLLYTLKDSLRVSGDTTLKIKDKEATVSELKSKISKLLKETDLSKEENKKILEEIYSYNYTSLTLTKSYNKDAFHRLINDKCIIDDGSSDKFMDVFVANKFECLNNECEPIYKPVYKSIVGLNGKQIKAYNDKDQEFGYQLDISSNTTEIPNQFGRKTPQTTTTYTYTLNDGSTLKVNTTPKSISGSLGKTHDILNCTIAYKRSNAPESITISTTENVGISKNLITGINNACTQNQLPKELIETLFVYSLDDNNKKKYFQAKIVNALDKPNWADEVQNIIGTMYSLDLLQKDSKRTCTDGREGKIIGAHTVYKKFIENISSGSVLYITQDGQILVNPNKDIKPKYYTLILG